MIKGASRAIWKDDFLGFTWSGEINGKQVCTRKPPGGLSKADFLG